MRVWLTPAVILAVAVLLVLSDLLGLQSTLSNGLFDAWQRHLPRLPSGQVRALAQTAWDEDSLVTLTRTLAGAGVREIVFAAPLSPAPSPQSLLAKLPPGSDAIRAALAQLPEPGHDLAAAITGIRVVLPVTLGAAGTPPRFKARFLYHGARNPFVKAPDFDTAAAGPAVLQAAASGLGAVNLMPDADGILRQMPVAVRLGHPLLPGLATEAARVAQGAPTITVTTDERDPLTFLRGVGIAALEGGATGTATIPDGRFRLDFSLPGALDGDIADLKDSIVVVGPPGRSVATPLGKESVAGVMAQGIDQILNGGALSRPAWAALAEAAGLALLGLVLVQLLRLGLGWTAGFVIVVAAGLFYGSWFAFVKYGLLLDAATPSLALALAFAGGAFAWIQELRQARAGLRLAFSDSLPRATIEKIARRPSLLTVEGETRTVTYLVCGVRGLVDLAASCRDDPAGFTRLMQLVLTPLIDQALAHGGTIDRLTADGFAAFWNAPLDDPDHALHACEAANGMSIMSSRVNELIAQQRGDGTPLPPIEIGVGVATGPVIAGGFGGYDRMGYSVNGDVVVLAGRIQALSHQYGPSVIVADVTRRSADRGFAWLEVDTVAAGVSDPAVTLYAMAGTPVLRASPKFRALTVFHDHIFQAIRKQQWGMARELIAQCRRLSGASQKLYDLQLSRIAWYENHPPGSDWDGAFRPIME